MSESRPQPDVDRPLPVAVPLPDGPPNAAPAPRNSPSGKAGRPKEKGKEKKEEADEKPQRQDPFVVMLLEYSPPWLVSMVFHMLLLIIMGLVIFSQAALRRSDWKPKRRRPSGATSRWRPTPRWACPTDRLRARAKYSPLPTERRSTIRWPGRAKWRFAPAAMPLTGDIEAPAWHGRTAARSGEARKTRPGMGSGGRT